MNHSDATKRNETHVGEREIVISRLFDAPREIVFEAWTKEEQLSKWWGPKGIRTTLRSSIGSRAVHGRLLCTVLMALIILIPNIFVEVVRHERIVMKHAVFPHFLATAIFEAREGKTMLTYNTIFEETAAVFDKVKTYAVPGAEQIMDVWRSIWQVFLASDNDNWSCWKNTVRRARYSLRCTVFLRRLLAERERGKCPDKAFDGCD